jgi:F-type H+-transporting ATPase subunit gamma
MVDRVVPMAAKSLLYSLYLESKTSEQASRRMAMESATDNAQELKDSLELSYNRLRQGAITQEITEIVGGANALQ